MSFKSRLLVPFAVCLVLFGCTNQIKQNIQQPTYISNNDPRWLQHLDELKKIKQYSLDGRIGYITKNKRFSVDFKLKYNDFNEYNLDFTSGLSNKALYIKSTSNGITITDENGVSKQSTDLNIDNVAKDIFGVKLPINKLFIWLKGQIEQNYNDYYVNEQALLDSFNYRNNSQTWNVKYNKYMLKYNVLLPQDILVLGDGIQLKIKIKNWE